MTTITRKYAMFTIGTGDYLLPGNDADTLWRLRKYKDITLDAQPERWEAFKWIHSLQESAETDRVPDPWDWDEWDPWGSGYRTRNEAIQEVLEG